MQNVRLASMKPNRTPAEDVRYRRNSGKHLLAMSSSQFDPSRTCARWGSPRPFCEPAGICRRVTVSAAITVRRPSELAL
jgi:hypothetical protein